MKIRPFDAGNWFPINNAVIDLIMPTLSPNAFKVLMIVIRATWGWVAINGERKTEDIISYSQFLERSGIGSDHTITTAIQECIKCGYLLRIQIARHQGTSRPIYSYALNVEFEIEMATAKTAPAATAKTAPAATAKTAPAATAKTALTKETKKQTNDVVVLLLQHNIIESVARDLAGNGCTSEMVIAWLEYMHSQTLTNPAAFLVSRLRLGEWPPEAQAIEDATAERKRRYAGGKYADIIQH